MCVSVSLCVYVCVCLCVYVAVPGFLTACLDCVSCAARVFEVVFQFRACMGSRPLWVSLCVPVSVALSISVHLAGVRPVTGDGE